MADDHAMHSTLPALGRYEIVRLLGRGAMGQVYEARDPNLDRRVAIKTIRVDGLAPDAADEYAARFRTEARSAARLQHPNIVSVYDSDRDGEVAYLVMEFVQGEDLKHHLDAGTRFTLEQTLRITADLLAALDYAHRQNIVHRDVKPANLLLEANGRVKLADFGVARIQDAGEATRTRGSMVGTLKYMSPEQVQGLPVDARSDLFAAGVVLYQLLTGRRPFEGDTDFAVIHQIVAQPLVPASSIQPQLPAALDAVLDRAMAKSREDRFPDAQAFTQALQDACGSLVDRTILAPPNQGNGFGVASSASQRGMRTGGSTASPGQRSAEDTSATVTQELELVYWKDVRDSPDAVDLEGFLARFPDGIYADLARRRLRKLGGQDTGTHGTQGSRGTRGSTAYDTTRMEAPTTVGTVGTVGMVGTLGQSAVPPPGPDATVQLVRAVEVAPPPEATDGTSVPPAPAQVLPTPPAVPAQGAAPAAPEAPRAPEPPAARVAPAASASPAAAPVPPARGKRGVLVLAGAAALVFGAFFVYQAMRSDASPAAVDAAALAASAPAVVSSAAVPSSSAPLPAPSQPAATLAVAGVSAPAEPAASAPASAVSATRNALRAQAPKGAASGPVAPASGSTPAATAVSGRGAVTGGGGSGGAAPSSISGTAATAAANVQPSARPAVASTASDPAKACEGRVLMGYQICLNEQCALPAFAQHPVCVERRAADKLRQERFHNERN